MLRRTKPVVFVVPRFNRRVQSERAAAPTLWTRRFARKSADAATASSRSARHVIAVTPIARWRAAPRLAARRSGLRVDAIGGAQRAASIIATISARTAPA